MREATPAESALIHNAPSRQMAVVDAAMRPEIRSIAAGIVERPRKVRKVPAAGLEPILNEVERIGGLTAVIAALDTDPRKGAQRLRLTYADPVAIVDEDGEPAPNEAILRHLDAVPSRALRRAVRDVLRRLPPGRRAMFVEEVYAGVPGHHFHRGPMFQECAVGVVGGLVPFTDLNETVQDAIVSSTAADLLPQLPVEAVVAALQRSKDARACDAVLNAVWSEGGSGLIDAIAAMWRSGSCTNQNIHHSIARLLATRDLLTDQELAGVAGHLGYQAGSTLALVPPHRREIVLRELPEDLKLRDVTGILETRGSMSDWAVCDVVRRSGPGELARWMKRGASGAVLSGELGIKAMDTAMTHWGEEELGLFVGELLEHSFPSDRPECRHFALNVPRGTRIIAAGGTVGRWAREYCYEHLGEDQRHWDYLRGLLPGWHGSITQLVRAAKAMTRAR